MARLYDESVYRFEAVEPSVRESGPGGPQIDDRVYRCGVAEVRRYCQAEVAAVRLVRDLLGDENIDAQIQGNARFEVAHSPRLARA